MTDRKWKITCWRFVVDMLVIGGAVGMAFAMKLSQPAIAFMVAGFADLTANVATYTIGNVTTKAIISKHYVAELDDRLVEPGEKTTGGNV